MLNSKNKDVLLLTWQKLKSEYLIFLAIPLVFGISEAINNQYDFSFRQEMLLHPVAFVHLCVSNAFFLEFIGFMVGALFMSTEGQSFSSILKKRNWKSFALFTLLYAVVIVVLLVSTAHSGSPIKPVDTYIAKPYLILVFVVGHTFNNATAGVRSSFTRAALGDHSGTVVRTVRANAKLFELCSIIALVFSGVVWCLHVSSLPSYLAYSLTSMLEVLLVSVFMATLAYDSGARPKARLKAVSTGAVFSS
ncbi:hypothetical protein [Photobacterium kishitanii]|uniref:Uncharacterized protein n=1 Tax=Photobacterium kishitanii TaxID=318456 RepID=A0A2T3KL64_9GAMM|nr:hypothetical protein [Photobacterium kishitanii]PSV00387.1 hypothetical protein C9J27_04465 [Photobacterium kishitanii]